MRVIVVPDSFKGSLSAVDVCRIVADAFARVGAEVVGIPVADGGEGTVAALALATGAAVCFDEVSGPYGAPVTAARATLPDATVVIELAQAAGLPLVGDDRRASDTTTYGVGEQLRAAAGDGARDIIVGIGGSATTDGGCGAAAACGVRFWDVAGRAFTPTGGTLRSIARIDAAGLDPALRAARITAMCDVDNPLTGPHGAAQVFGPQKGADPAEVVRLDEGLSHLAGVIRRDLGLEVASLPGAGAAGGMGAGLVAFFGAELRPGIDVVLDAVGFDALLVDADAVVTGEGSFDEQSLRGKVIDGVARRARAAGVPVHVLAGRVAPGMAAGRARLGIRSATAVAPAGVPLGEALAGAEGFLAAAAARLAEGMARATG